MNWNLLLALFLPYFLRSLLRESRVRNPAFFRAARNDASIFMSDLAIPSFIAPAWPLNPPPLQFAKTSILDTMFAVSMGCMMNRDPELRVRSAMTRLRRL